MTPEISVVVPSHRRPDRLRRLLDAMAGQTLERGRWELIVATAGEGAEVAASHPAGARVVSAASTGAAAQRNAGWRAASAPLVLFTDDDCRPAPDWVERALTAAGEHPGAVVQGATHPDPAEAHLLSEPYARTQDVDPPGPWAQTCNILYPRDLLERLGGFDEEFTAGEDTDLAQRAAEAGAAYVGAPDAVVHHAVESRSLREHLRTIPRWRTLALVVKRHPHLREHLPAGVFWKRSHLWLPLAGAGAALALRGRPLLGAALVLPWARVDGRGLAELPGRAVVDAAEMVTMLRGSIHYRTPLL